MSEKSTSSADPVRSRSPSHHRSTERRHESIICKPLDTLSDIEEFLKDPPAWRSLCIELRPHSEYAIKNIDIVRQNHASDQDIAVERPETFCHFTLDSKDVRRTRRKDLPKTLVCHDMANGYHDDCNIDGTGNFDAYTFYNWAAVDIFCYFSHHFITIPPLGWINVAHAHGVQVLGTVITEWGDGAAVWEQLLASPERWQEFAASLVAIAKTLRFDGWLLNIENKISKPTELIAFVRFLHGLLHRELSSPLLLWYDSVTAAGALAWQNGLNHHNKEFFSACDGMFTNYSWSARHVAASAAAAGARRRDVFVGVDVWGRHFLGGGMFNTQEAVKIVHKHGCSLAIFAPAWTHEAMESDSSDSFTQFRLRELALWGSLWPFLNTKLPSQLPFSTSFCTGQGRKRRLYGEVLGPVPWYNLRHQQYQPNSALGPHGYILIAENPEQNLKQISEKSNEEQNKVDAPEPKDVLPPNATRSDEEPANTPKTYTRYQLLPVKDTPCISLHLSDSFTGGGCLLLQPSADRCIRLFHCDFLVRHTLVACVVTKTLPQHEDQTLNLIVDVDDGRRIVLVGAGGGDAGMSGVLAVYPATGLGFKDVQRYLLLNEPGFYVSVENSYGWKVRYYSVRVSGGRVTSLGCGARAPVLLGHLGLCHRYDKKTEETN